MKKCGVILCVDVPSNIGPRARDEYQNTQGRIDTSIQDIEKLGENAWLIPLPSGLPALGQLVSVCEFLSWEYRLMHIDHEAVWVNYGKDKRQVSEG